MKATNLVQICICHAACCQWLLEQKKHRDINSCWLEINLGIHTATIREVTLLITKIGYSQETQWHVSSGIGLGFNIIHVCVVMCTWQQNLHVVFWAEVNT